MADNQQTEWERIEEELRRWHGDALNLIVHKVAKIDTVLDTQRQQQATLDKLTDAVSRLAVIEERQNTDRRDMQYIRDSINSVATSVKSVADRVDKLESAEVENKRLRNAMWALAGVILLGVAVTVMAKAGIPIK